jgi:hypothetical protein
MEILMHAKMKSHTYARSAVLAGVICLGSTLSGQAMAGCGWFAPPGSPVPMDERAQPRASGLMSAVYRPGAERIVRVSDDQQRSAGIVGLWRVTFISDGTAYPGPIPFGAVVDFGTQQWHSDGTEFLISGGRAPSTGDVCMGVWERVEGRT